MGEAMTGMDVPWVISPGRGISGSHQVYLLLHPRNEASLLRRDCSSSVELLT